MSELFQNKQFVVMFVFVVGFILWYFIDKKFKIRYKFCISNKYLRVLFRIFIFLVIIIPFQYLLFVYDENPHKQLNFMYFYNFNKRFVFYWALIEIYKFYKKSKKKK